MVRGSSMCVWVGRLNDFKCARLQMQGFKRDNIAIHDWVPVKQGTQIIKLLHFRCNQARGLLILGPWWYGSYKKIRYG